jgi:hypothetical protein
VDYSRFPMPAEEKPDPRRSGTYPLGEVSFTVDDDGCIRFFNDVTSGHALTEVEVRYIVDRGKSLDDYEISEILWSIPGEGNWRKIGPLVATNWAIEDLLKEPKEAAIFARWREEHSEEMPYPALNRLLAGIVRRAA